MAGERIKANPQYASNSTQNGDLNELQILDANPDDSGATGWEQVAAMRNQFGQVGPDQSHALPPAQGGALPPAGGGTANALPPANNDAYGYLPPAEENEAYGYLPPAEENEAYGYLPPAEGDEAFGYLPPAPNEPFGALPPAPNENVNALPPAPGEDANALPPAAELPALPAPAEATRKKYQALTVEMTSLYESARFEAQQALNAELSQSGLFKNLWKGTLFKGFYLERYKQEIADGTRKIDYNGQEVTLEERMIAQNRADTLGRLGEFAADRSAEDLLHKGESVGEVNVKETERVKESIREVYRDGIRQGLSPKEIADQYEESLKLKKAEARDRGEKFDTVQFDNIAETAREMIMAAENLEGLQNVLEGFEILDAKATDAVHSKEHLNTVNKITDWLDKRGLMVPALAVATAAGAVSAFAKSGVKAIGGVAGSIAFSGVLAGMKAYNDTTQNRATMQRAKALGEEFSYQSEDPDLPKNRRTEKARQNEAKIGATTYEMAKASDLTTQLTDAVSSGKVEDLTKAIADASVRIKFTEAADKDMIAYSSIDDVSREDHELRVALIQARKALKEHDGGAEQLEAMEKQVSAALMEDVENKDKAFNDIRRKTALKAGFKAVGIGVASYFGSQEIGALFNPRQIGLLEKLNVVQTTNDVDAEQTVLTELFTGPNSYIAESVEVSGDDLEKLQQYRNQGYTETEVQSGTTTTRTITETVPAGQGTGNVTAHVEWANNGTSYSDGNELRIFSSGNHQVVSGFHGISSLANGAQINVGQLAANNQLTGLVTVQGKQFLVQALGVDPSGNPFFDENGLINLINPDGSSAGTMDISNFAYDKFSVGSWTGNNPDGTINFVSYATDVMNRGGNAVINQVREIAENVPPIFRFDRTATAGMATGGIPVGALFANNINRSHRRRAEAEKPAEPEVEVTPTDHQLPPAQPEAEITPTDHQLPPAESEPGAAADHQLPPTERERQNATESANGEEIRERGPSAAARTDTAETSTSDTSAAETDNASANTADTGASETDAQNTEQNSSQTTEQTANTENTTTAETATSTSESESRNNKKSKYEEKFQKRIKDQDYSIEEYGVMQRIAGYEDLLQPMGILFITDRYKHPDFEKQYETWYQGLTDAGKAAVVDCLKIIDESHALGQNIGGRREPTTMGNAFREWFNANHANGA